MPKFLLKFHAAVIKEIPIEKTPMTIGRKPDNDVVIDNMAVSGHHARITMQGNMYVIEDTQSTNGTFLNDKKILNSALKNNDQILIGQHTLVFINPEEQPRVVDSEATVIMTPDLQQKILQQEANKAAAAQPAAPAAPPASSAASKPSAKPDGKTGILRVIEGKAEQNEYSLTNLLTYIGKSSTAAIKIKGMFAPDIAALISKRPEGYLITAVKDGYPKLNSNTLSGQAELKDGDLIEVGGIKFLFQLKDVK
ncbi:MAG: FHA domain-containing protein [Elusimicrobia bacterium]|nr:FHA domain-containing protein [Candidatus Liberimonas magnetica]